MGCSPCGGGSTTVQAPAPRDVAGEYKDTMLAQMQAMTGTGDFAEVGSIPELEAQLRPGMEELDLASFERMLGGVGDQRGMLDLYQQEVYPQMSEIEKQAMADRAEADQGILKEYGGQVADNLRSAAGNKDLLEGLRTQAEGDLAAGADLNPVQAREFRNHIREAQAARGLGFGESDAIQEAMAMNSAGEQRLAERMGRAQGVAGSLQASGGDPMLALHGRPSQTMGMGQGFGAQAYGAGAGIGSRVVNPESQYASDIYNSNIQSQLAAGTATAANNASMVGGGLGMLGALGGGWLQGR